MKVNRARLDRLKRQIQERADRRLQRMLEAMTEGELRETCNELLEYLPILRTSIPK